MIILHFHRCVCCQKLLNVILLCLKLIKACAKPFKLRQELVPFSGNNPLMRQLYEVDVPPEALTDRIPPTCPALWRYRTQVTLDHFSHTFQQEVLSTDSESNKILAEFLREVNQLNCIKSSLDSAV